MKIFLSGSVFRLAESEALKTGRIRIVLNVAAIKI